MKAPVAVIILNWNGHRLLREYLPDVLANTNPGIGQVIVADNASTDGSAELLAADFPQVPVISFDKNYGFAEGYNRAIAAVEHPWVVLLNSDVRPAPGWLDALWDYAQGHPRTIAMQPKILSVADPTRFEYAGAAGGFLDRHGYPYCRGRIFDTCETDTGQYDIPLNVDWATGAALMVRRDQYLACGGLDPRFFAHMEEIDLCWRLRLAGWDIAAVPSSTVYHLGGGSLPSGNPRKTYLNFRNNLLMLHKNLPDSTRRRKLLVRRLLDTVAMLKFLASGQWANARAVVRAHNDFRRMRRHYTSHPTQDLLAAKTDILVQYYIRGIKKYSDLR